MMGKKNWDRMTSTEVMAAKIDEIYDRLSLIENLLVDLSPGFGKISKEIGPTIKDLREVYERDETLTLVKKAGENIPAFLELLNVMEAMKGLMEDLIPAVGKITKEVSPTIKDLREVYERDETLTLIKKAGENIPTLVTLVDLMQTMKGLIEDLMPAVGKITKELTPTITMLRESLEKDEVLDLIQKTGENVNTFNKLLDFLNKFDKSGTLDFTLENMAAKEMDYIIKGMQKCIVRTMQQFAEKPPEPGLRNILAAMRDPEVQKGILFMTAIARNLTKCISEACTFEISK